MIGWRTEIERLNADDAQRFYRRYYAPDNAVLVVAGAVSLSEVRALAQTHYGPLRPSGTPRTPRVVAQNLRVADYMQPEILADARVRQNSWRRYYRLPQYQRADKRQFAAADVLAEILSGGLTGRLYQKLVVEKNWRSAPVLIAIPAASIMANLSFTQPRHRKPTSPIWRKPLKPRLTL